MSRPLSHVAADEIGIDPAAREPIQTQIARQFRALVLSGRLRPGAKLPSTRALAVDLQVARATVVEAYQQLLSEGYMEARRGSGSRVAAELPEALLKLKSAKAGSPEPVRKIRNEEARAFRSGLVDWEHFPHDTWGRLLGRHWRKPPKALLECHDPFGWPDLRQAIARHLFEWRGISCDPSQVIVTAGGVDALDLVSRSVLRQHDKVWIEEPGYPAARKVFAAAGIRTIPVPIDADGLIVQAGRDEAPDARAAFVTPARHYPTGVTMPLSRRLELLNWAEASGAIIIEDDYDSEYRYVGHPLPALMSLGHRARVIYCGSFSKVFSPLLRLGFLIVPDAMRDVFRTERLAHGAPPSLLAQPVLAEFIGSGEFAVHIRRMRRIYAARRAALIETLKPADNRLFTIDASPSGLMILLRLPEGQSDERIAVWLLQAGIEVQTLSSHYAGSKPQQGLLLSFAGFAERDLRSAAARLIERLEQ